MIDVKTFANFVESQFNDALQKTKFKNAQRI